MTLQTLYLIITFIVIHWVADFPMQDEEWALGKSKAWKPLLSTQLCTPLCGICVWLYGAHIKTT